MVPGAGAVAMIPKSVRPMKRIGFPWIRWILLILYALLVLAFFSASLLTKDLEFRYWVLGIITFTLGSQAIFILGVGNKSLFRPQRGRRLILPVTISGAMMAVLVGAFALAMIELFKLDSNFGGNIEEVIYWSFVGLNWIGWSVFFYIHTRKRERFLAFKRMTTFVLAGSLAELLAAIPSHLIVSRRPGCLVGLLTMFSIIAGVGVMAWSFGPGIAFLFLRDRRKREEAADDAETLSSKRQFSLSGLLLVSLFIAALMATLLVKPYPGTDPLLRVEAWITIGLAVVLLVLFLRRVFRFDGERSDDEGRT